MIKEFKIVGMSCNHCVMAVEKGLSHLKIKKYEVKIGSASIDFDENELKEEEIIKAIGDAGYKVVH